MISYNSVDDSCYCFNNVFFDDSEFVIGLTPEESIEGISHPLDSIILKVKNQLINEYLRDSAHYELFMMLIIDENGQMRCGKIQRGKKDVISQRAFELLMNEKYRPAYQRKHPIVDYFMFILMYKRDKYIINH